MEPTKVIPRQVEYRGVKSEIYRKLIASLPKADLELVPFGLGEKTVKFVVPKKLGGERLPSDAFIVPREVPHDYLYHDRDLPEPVGYLCRDNGDELLIVILKDVRGTTPFVMRLEKICQSL